jgi:hypothetical protein
MVGVKPEVHRELKKLQKTPYGEQTMSWVIANLLKASRFALEMHGTALTVTRSFSSNVKESR